MTETNRLNNDGLINRDCCKNAQTETKEKRLN